MLARQTPQPDIRAQAHHRPIRSPAWMRLAESYHVSNVDFDEFRRAHRCCAWNLTRVTARWLHSQRGRR